MANRSFDVCKNKSSWKCISKGSIGRKKWAHKQMKLELYIPIYISRNYVSRCNIKEVDWLKTLCCVMPSYEWAVVMSKIPPSPSLPPSLSMLSVPYIMAWQFKSVNGFNSNSYILILDIRNNLKNHNCNLSIISFTIRFMIRDKFPVCRESFQCLISVFFKLFWATAHF